VGFFFLLKPTQNLHTQLKSTRMPLNKGFGRGGVGNGETFIHFVFEKRSDM